MDRAQANLVQSRAHLARLQLDYNRFEKLLPTKAISQEDFDKAAGDREEAAGGGEGGGSGVAVGAVEPGFHHGSGVDQRADQPTVDRRGEPRAGGRNAVTTIVSLHPIYAYFDIDERTTLRIRRLVQSGEDQSEEFQVKVDVGLTDETGFPHKGSINFVDNRVEVTTGTLRLRAVLDNSRRLFSPGMFARIQLPVGEPHSAILVAGITGDGVGPGAQVRVRG